MILALHNDNWVIEDENHKIYIPEEARMLVETGKVEDCNLSFQRLMQYDFNLEKVKNFYFNSEQEAE